MLFDTTDGKPALRQLTKAPGNNVYQHIGIELSWKPSDVDSKRLTTFLETSFAGNSEGRLVCDCAELLGLLNAMVVP